MVAVLLASLLVAASAGGRSDACVREFEAKKAGWVRMDVGDLVPRCGPGLAARGPQGEELPLAAPQACAAALPSRWVTTEIERVDEAPGCIDQGLATICDLLPLDGGDELVGLAIETEREEAPGFRFYGINFLQVTLLAEGTFLSNAPRPLVLHLASGGASTEGRRLELYGLRRPPGVRRLGYRLRLVRDPSQACAYAPQAGRYRLFLGHPPVFRAPPPPAAGVVVRRLRVRAPGAAPGQVVQLELPEWIYRATGSGDRVWSAVRLTAGGQWLAFRRWNGRVRAVGLHAVRPRPTTGNVLSIIDLGMPPVRASHRLQLTAASSAAPFARTVIVPNGPGAVPGESAALLSPWECSSRPPLPCRLDLDLGERLITSRWLALREGGNAPLGELEITSWQQSERLAFRWPLHGPVWIETGESPAGYPDDELRAPDDLGHGEAWIHAFVDPAVGSLWPLHGSMLLAAGVLVALLLRYRSLPRVGEPHR